MQFQLYRARYALSATLLPFAKNEKNRPVILTGEIRPIKPPSNSKKLLDKSQITVGTERIRAVVIRRNQYGTALIKNKEMI